MGNGFIGWFNRSYKAIIIVLLAIMAGTLVVLAMQQVNGSKPAAGATANPLVETTASPAAVSTVTLTKQAEPADVLYLGDSLTYGAFASAPAASYRALVDASLNQQTPIRSDFVGGSGKSSIDITPNITDKAYDLVIVEVGTNDATNQPSGSISKNYDALLDKVRAASPNAQLICAGSWQTSYQASKVDGGIFASCRAHKGIFVPLQAYYQNANNRGPDKRQTFYGVADNFHPNDAGHKAIADAILSRITVQ
jgi:acyl-CoA thioesterase-1